MIKFKRYECFTKYCILHLFQLHLVSAVTRSEHVLLIRVPQVHLQEVSRLHRSLQQHLVPQHGSNPSEGRQHQACNGGSGNNDARGGD